MSTIRTLLLGFLSSLAAGVFWDQIKSMLRSRTKMESDYLCTT